METVKFKPLTQWAKNRCKQHGCEFEVLRRVGDKWLVQSLKETWRGANGKEKWKGWFVAGEEVEIVPE